MESLAWDEIFPVLLPGQAPVQPQFTRTVLVSIGKLADLITLLYQNEGLRQRMGQAAAKNARQYTWDRNAEQLGQLFQEVLRRKKSRDYADQTDGLRGSRRAKSDSV